MCWIPFSLIPVSMNFEVLVFFFFQVNTITKYFEVAFLHPFFGRGHTSSTMNYSFRLFNIVCFFFMMNRELDLEDQVIFGQGFLPLAFVKPMTNDNAAVSVP